MTSPRNRLLPWFIGLAINLAVIAFIGGRMYAGECPAPTILELGYVPTGDPGRLSRAHVPYLC